MRFTIGHHSSLLHSSPQCWCVHLLCWWGCLVPQDLLAGSRAGSQRAAGLPAASSFSLKNATSSSFKHTATALQLSHPNGCTTLTRQCILSFETKRFSTWKMSGVTYRHLPKYFPGLSNSQAQQQQSFWQTNRPAPAAYSKEPFSWSKERLYK